jgi:SOS response associated peptidase (SRAP)
MMATRCPRDDALVAAMRGAAAPQWLRLPVPIGAANDPPMCGRYPSFLPAEAIARIFGTVNPLPNLAPSCNVAPTQAAAVVRRNPDKGGRHLDMLKWGLLPYWTNPLPTHSRFRLDHITECSRSQINSVRPWANLLWFSGNLMVRRSPSMTKSLSRSIPTSDGTSTVVINLPGPSKRTLPL